MSACRPMLIVVEGPDGVGKSSTVHKLVKAVEDRHGPATSLAFPGRKGGTLGALVHKLHHEPNLFDITSITPLALQALHVAAHLDVIETVIKPLLARGTNVVLDRFWWSTWVYGTVHGINPNVLQRLIDVEIAAWDTCLPDVAILLDRTAPLKPEPQDSWALLKAEYARLAKQEALKYPVHTVSNESNHKDTLNTICQILADAPAK